MFYTHVHYYIMYKKHEDVYIDIYDIFKIEFVFLNLFKTLHIKELFKYNMLICTNNIFDILIFLISLIIFIEIY